MPSNLNLFFFLAQIFLYDLNHVRDYGKNRETFSFVFWFKWKLQNLLSNLTDL